MNSFRSFTKEIIGILDSKSSGMICAHYIQKRDWKQFNYMFKYMLKMNKVDVSLARSLISNFTLIHEHEMVLPVLVALMKNKELF